MRPVLHRFPQVHPVVAGLLLTALCAAKPLPSSADAMGDYMWRQFVFRTMPRQTLMNAQLLYGDAAYRAAREKIGRERVQSGRATTLFVRGPYQAPAAWAAESPAAQQQEVLNLYTQELQAFDRVATGLHVRLNDAAECSALAFSISYYIYSGQEVSNAQRADYARQWRETFLRDPLYQGTDDKHRQLAVEQAEAYTVMAASKLNAAKKSGDASMRKEAVDTAAAVLAALWSKPVSTIVLTSAGFRVRGDVAIASGKATTRFAVSSTALSTDPEVAKAWTILLRVAKVGNATTADAAQLGATAFAVNYNLYSGRTLTEKQFAWVLHAMSNRLIQNSTWQGFSDAEKQQHMEQIAADAVAAVKASQAAEGQAAKPETLTGPLGQIAQNEGVDNATMARSASARARAVAKKNLDGLYPGLLDDYVLTENGFAPRSGAQR